MANLFDNLFSNIKDTKEDEKNKSNVGALESNASKFDRQISEPHANVSTKAAMAAGSTGGNAYAPAAAAGVQSSAYAVGGGSRGRSASSSSKGSVRRDSAGSQERRRDVSSRDLYPQNMTVENANKECIGFCDEAGDEVLDIDTLKKFTIPKRQKARKGLYEDLTLDSREFKNEVFTIIQQNFKDRGGSTQSFKFQSAQLIHNQNIIDEYLEKKKEMRLDGYSEKEIADSYAFLLIFDHTELHQVCKEGIRAGNVTSSCIGDATKGVSLCRYSDILRPSPFYTGMKGKLLIFKIMRGKVKQMVENRGEIPLDPTPNFDCHISKTSTVDPSQVGTKQAFESTQLYIYEYDEDLEPKARPRQICPYAVVKFQYLGTGETKPIKPIIKPSPVSRGPSIPAPKPVTAPKEIQRTEWGSYVVWTGVLKNKNTLSCNVELVTYNTAIKPARIPNEILMNMIYPLSVLESRFLSNVTCLVRGKETKHNGKFYNCCDIRAQKGDEGNLRRLIKFLELKKKFLITKFEEDVTVLLIPDCDLTVKAGLPSSKTPLLSLHCIFVSPKSRMAVFKGQPSMGYSPAGSLHQDGIQSRDGALQSPSSEDGLLSRQCIKKHYDHHGRATSTASSKIQQQTNRPRAALTVPNPVEIPAETKNLLDIAQSGGSTADPKLLDLVYKLTSGKIDNKEAITQMAKIVANQSVPQVPQTAALSSQEALHLQGSKSTLRKHDIDLREPPKPTRVTSMMQEFPDDSHEFYMPRRTILRKFVIQNTFKAEGKVQDKRNFELVRSGGSLNSGTRVSYHSFMPLHAPYVPSRDGPPPGAKKAPLTPFGTPKELWGQQVGGKQMMRDPRFRHNSGTGSEAPVSAESPLGVANVPGATSSGQSHGARQQVPGAASSLGNLLSEEVLPTATLTSILQKFSPGQFKAEASSKLKLPSVEDKSGGSSPADDPDLAEQDLYSMGQNSGSNSPIEVPQVEEEQEEAIPAPKPKTGFYSTYSPSDIEKQLFNLNSPKKVPSTLSGGAFSSSSALQEPATISTDVSGSVSTPAESKAESSSDTTPTRPASELAKSLLEKLHIPVKSNDIADALLKQNMEAVGSAGHGERPQPGEAQTTSLKTQLSEECSVVNETESKGPQAAPTGDEEVMDEDEPIKSVESMKSFLNEDVDKTEKLSLPMKSGIKRKAEDEPSESVQPKIQKSVTETSETCVPDNISACQPTRTAGRIHVEALQRVPATSGETERPAEPQVPHPEPSQASVASDAAALPSSVAPLPSSATTSTGGDSKQTTNAGADSKTKADAEKSAETTLLPASKIKKEKDFTLIPPHNIKTEKDNTLLPASRIKTETAENIPLTAANIKTEKDDMTAVGSAKLLNTNSKYFPFLLRITKDNGNFEGNYLPKSGLDLPVRKLSRSHVVRCGAGMTDVSVIFKWNCTSEKLNNNEMTPLEMIQASVTSAVHKRAYRFKRDELSEREKINEIAVKKVLHRVRNKLERRVSIAKTPVADRGGSERSQKSAVAPKSAQQAVQKSPPAADKPTGLIQDDPVVPSKTGAAIASDEQSSGAASKIDAVPSSQPTEVQTIRGLSGPVPPPGFISLSKYVPMKGITPFETSQAQSTYIQARSTCSQASAAALPTSSAAGAGASTGFSKGPSISKEPILSTTGKNAEAGNDSSTQANSVQSQEETGGNLENVKHGVQNQHAAQPKNIEPPRKKTKRGESNDEVAKSETLMKEIDDDVPVLTHDTSVDYITPEGGFTSFQKSSQQKAGIKLVLCSPASETDKSKSVSTDAEVSSAQPVAATSEMASVTLAETITSAPTTLKESSAAPVVSRPLGPEPDLPQGRTIPVLMNRALQKRPPVVAPTPVYSVSASIPAENTKAQKIPAISPVSSLVVIPIPSTTPSTTSSMSTVTTVVPSGSSCGSRVSVAEVKPQAPVTGPASVDVPSGTDVKASSLPSPSKKVDDTSAVRAGGAVSTASTSAGDAKKEVPGKRSLTMVHCGFCWKSFKGELALSKHQDATGHGVARRLAAKAQETATAESKAVTLEPNDVASSSTKAAPNTKLQCGFCWNTFKNSEELLQHRQKTGHSTPDLSTVKELEDKAAKKIEMQNKAKEIQEQTVIADRSAASTSKKIETLSSQPSASTSRKKEEYCCDVCEKSFEFEKDLDYHVQCSGHAPSFGKAVHQTDKVSGDRLSRRFHPYEKSSWTSSKPLRRTPFVPFQNLKELMADMTTPMYKWKRERGEQPAIPQNTTGARFKDVKFVRSTEDPLSSQKFDLKALNEPDKDEALVDERPDDFEMRKTQTMLLAAIMGDDERESVGSGAGDQDKDSGHSSKDDSDFSEAEPLDDEDEIHVLNPQKEGILEPEDYSFEIERTTRSYAALLRGGILGRPPEPPELPQDVELDTVQPEEFDDDAFCEVEDGSASEPRCLGALFRTFSVPEAGIERDGPKDRRQRSMSVAEWEKKSRYRLHRIDVDLREKVYQPNTDMAADTLVEADVNSEQDPRRQKKDYCKPKFNVEECWKRVDLKSRLLSNLVITITCGDSGDESSSTDDDDIPECGPVIKSEQMEEGEGYNLCSDEQFWQMGDAKSGEELSQAGETVEGGKSSDKVMSEEVVEFYDPSVSTSSYDRISLPGDEHAFAMNSSCWDTQSQVHLAPRQESLLGVVRSSTLKDPRIRQFVPPPPPSPPPPPPPPPPPQSSGLQVARLQSSRPPIAGTPLPPMGPLPGLPPEINVQQTLNLLRQVGVELPPNQVALLWSTLKNQQQEVEQNSQDKNNTVSTSNSVDKGGTSSRPSNVDTTCSTPKKCTMRDKHDQSQSQEPIVFDYQHSSPVVYRRQRTPPRSRSDHTSYKTSSMEGCSPRSPRSGIHSPRKDSSPGHSCHSPCRSRKDSSPGQGRRESSPSHYRSRDSSGAHLTHRRDLSPSKSTRDRYPNLSSRRESSPSRSSRNHSPNRIGRDSSPRQSIRRHSSPSRRDHSPRPPSRRDSSHSSRDHSPRPPSKRDSRHSSRDHSPRQSSRPDFSPRHRDDSPCRSGRRDSSKSHHDSPHPSDIPKSNISRSSGRKDTSPQPLRGGSLRQARGENVGPDILKKADNLKESLPSSALTQHGVVQKDTALTPALDHSVKGTAGVTADGKEVTWESQSQSKENTDDAVEVAVDDDLIVVSYTKKADQPVQEITDSDDGVAGLSKSDPKANQERNYRFDKVVVGADSEKDPKAGVTGLQGSPAKFSSRKAAKLEAMKAFIAKAKKREDAKKLEDMKMKNDAKKKEPKIAQTHGTVKSEMDRFRQMERAVLSKANYNFNTLNIGDFGKALNDSETHFSQLKTSLSQEANEIRNISKIVRSELAKFEDNLREKRLDSFNFEIDALKSQSIGIDTSFDEEFPFPLKFDTESTPDSSPEKKQPLKGLQEDVGTASHFRPLQSLFQKDSSDTKRQGAVDMCTNEVMKEVYKKLNVSGLMGNDSVACTKEDAIKDWENEVGALTGDPDYWSPKSEKRKIYQDLKPLRLCPIRRLDEVDGITKTVQGEIFNTLLKISDLVFEKSKHAEAFLREQENLSPVRDNLIKTSCNGSYWLDMGGKIFEGHSLSIPAPLTLEGAPVELKEEQVPFLQPLKIDTGLNYDDLPDSLYSPSQPTQDSPNKKYGQHFIHEDDQVRRPRYVEGSKTTSESSKARSQQKCALSGVHQEDSPHRKKPKDDRIVKRMLADIDGYSKWEQVEISTSSESDIPNRTGKTNASHSSCEGSPVQKPKLPKRSAVVRGKSHALYSITMMKDDKGHESSESDSDGLLSQIEMAIAESLQPKPLKPRRRSLRKRSSQDTKTGTAVDDITDSDDDLVGSETESDSGCGDIEPVTNEGGPVAEEKGAENDTMKKQTRCTLSKPASVERKPELNDMFTFDEPEFTMKPAVTKMDTHTDSTCPEIFDSGTSSCTPKDCASRNSSFREVDEVPESSRILPARFKLDLNLGKDQISTTGAQSNVEEADEVKSDPNERKSPELGDVLRMRFPHLRGRGNRGRERGYFAKRGGRKASDMDAARQKRRGTEANAAAPDDDYMNFVIEKHVVEGEVKKTGGNPVPLTGSPTKGMGGKNLLLKAFKQMVQTKRPPGANDADNVTGNLVEMAKDEEAEECETDVAPYSVVDGSFSYEKFEEAKKGIDKEHHNEKAKGVTSPARTHCSDDANKSCYQVVRMADIPLPAESRPAQDGYEGSLREELFETPVFRRSLSRSPKKQLREEEDKSSQECKMEIQKQKFVKEKDSLVKQTDHMRRSDFSPPRTKARMLLEIQRAEGRKEAEDSKVGGESPPKTKARLLLELERAEGNKPGSILKHRESSSSYWAAPDDAKGPKFHDRYNRCFRSQYSYDHDGKSDRAPRYAEAEKISEQQSRVEKSKSPNSGQYWQRKRSPVRKLSGTYLVRSRVTDDQKLKAIQCLNESLSSILGPKFSTASATSAHDSDSKPFPKHLHSLSKMSLSVYHEQSIRPLNDTTPYDSEVSDWESTPDHSSYSVGSEDNISSNDNTGSDTDVSVEAAEHKSFPRVDDTTKESLKKSPVKSKAPEKCEFEKENANKVKADIDILIHAKKVLDEHRVLSPSKRKSIERDQILCTSMMESPVGVAFSKIKRKDVPKVEKVVSALVDEVEDDGGEIITSRRVQKKKMRRVFLRRKGHDSASDYDDDDDDEPDLCSISTTTTETETGTGRLDPHNTPAAGSQEKNETAASQAEQQDISQSRTKTVPKARSNSRTSIGLSSKYFRGDSPHRHRSKSPQHRRQSKSRSPQRHSSLRSRSGSPRHLYSAGRPRSRSPVYHLSNRSRSISHSHHSGSGSPNRSRSGSPYWSISRSPRIHSSHWSRSRSPSNWSRSRSRSPLYHHSQTQQWSARYHSSQRSRSRSPQYHRSQRVKSRSRSPQLHSSHRSRSRSRSRSPYHSRRHSKTRCGHRSESRSPGHHSSHRSRSRSPYRSRSRSHCRSRSRHRSKSGSSKCQRSRSSRSPSIKERHDSNNSKSGYSQFSRSRSNTPYDYHARPEGPYYQYVTGNLNNSTVEPQLSSPSMKVDVTKSIELMLKEEKEKSAAKQAAMASVAPPPVQSIYDTISTTSSFSEELEDGEICDSEDEAVANSKAQEEASGESTPVKVSSSKSYRHDDEPCWHTNKSSKQQSEDHSRRKSGEEDSRRKSLGSSHSPRRDERKLSHSPRSRESWSSRRQTPASDRSSGRSRKDSPGGSRSKRDSSDASRSRTDSSSASRSRKDSPVASKSRRDSAGASSRVGSGDRAKKVRKDEDVEHRSAEGRLIRKGSDSVKEKEKCGGTHKSGGRGSESCHEQTRITITIKNDQPMSPEQSASEKNPNSRVEQLKRSAGYWDVETSADEQETIAQSSSRVGMDSATATESETTLSARFQHCSPVPGVKDFRAGKALLKTMRRRSSDPTGAEVHHGDCTPPAKRRYKRGDSCEPSRRKTYAYVYSTADDTADHVKKHLASLNIQLLDLYEISRLLDSGKSSTEILIFVHKKDIPRAHLIPNFVNLRKDSRVVFCLYNDVAEVKEGTYQCRESFSPVGSNEDTFLDCSPASMAAKSLLYSDAMISDAVEVLKCDSTKV